MAALFNGRPRFGSGQIWSVSDRSRDPARNAAPPRPPHELAELRRSGFAPCGAPIVIRISFDPSAEVDRLDGSAYLRHPQSWVRRRNKSDSKPALNSSGSSCEPKTPHDGGNSGYEALAGGCRPSAAESLLGRRPCQARLLFAAFEQLPLDLASVQDVRIPSGGRAPRRCTGGRRHCAPGLGTSRFFSFRP